MAEQTVDELDELLDQMQHMAQTNTTSGTTDGNIGTECTCRDCPHHHTGSPQVPVTGIPPPPYIWGVPPVTCYPFLTNQFGYFPFHPNPQSLVPPPPGFVQTSPVQTSADMDSGQSRTEGRVRRRISSRHSSDSEDSSIGHGERVPTLRPGQFDGTTSWNEYINHFENCAVGNNWPDKTKCEQLKHNLTGQAFSIVHQNPNSKTWTFAQLVEELCATFGPNSQHSSILKLQLRNRKRQSGEELYKLRNDIYEKVTNAYSDRSLDVIERIGVDVFIESLTDTEQLERVLEQNPKTLKEAYEIAHSFESARSAAQFVAENSSRDETYTGKTKTVLEPKDVGNSEKVKLPETDVPLKQIQCFNCKGWGHKQQHCVSSKSNNFKSSFKWTRKCYKCRRAGHYAADCPLSISSEFYPAHPSRLHDTEIVSPSEVGEESKRSRRRSRNSARTRRSNPRSDRDIKKHVHYQLKRTKTTEDQMVQCNLPQVQVEVVTKLDEVPLRTSAEQTDPPFVVSAELERPSLQDSAEPETPTHTEYQNDHEWFDGDILTGTLFCEDDDSLFDTRYVHTANLFQGWTLEEIRDAQFKDPDIGPVMKMKVAGWERPKFKSIGHLSLAGKSYWSQWNRLKVHSGVLVKEFWAKDASSKWLQIVLPKPLRSDILKQLHDSPSGGHLGTEKTYKRVHARFCWYKMKEDITLWCKTCIQCAKHSRPQKTPRASMGSVRSGAPMERIAVDICGPLQETERHNVYILVIQDSFSKWVEAYPIPNQEAKTIADTIVSQWISRYGTPYSLHSDQGSNFESSIFKEVCQLLGIEKTHTTPYHPQSDGFVERFNGTLKNILSTTSDKCHFDWDKMIPLALMAYRASPHCTTGVTPNKMLFGREILEPIDIVVGLPPDHEQPQNIPEYVQDLRENLELAHSIAREATGKSVEIAKREYDKKKHEYKYEIGDPVWLLVKGIKKPKGKVPKFLPNYEGPYFIIGIIDPQVYIIQESPRSKAKVIHHDRLKPMHSRESLENGWVFKQAHKYSEIHTESIDLNCETESRTNDQETIPSKPSRIPVSVKVPERAKRQRKPPDRFGDWVTPRKFSKK